MLKRSLLFVSVSLPLVFSSTRLFANSPTPPAPPANGHSAAPALPAPPAPPSKGGSGDDTHIQVRLGNGDLISVKGNTVTFNGSALASNVANGIASVRAAIGKDPSVPADVKASIQRRLDGVQKVLTARLANRNQFDLSKLDSEMDKLGKDIDAQLKGLDAELESYSKKYGKDFMNKFNFNWSKTLNKWQGAWHNGNINADFDLTFDSPFTSKDDDNEDDSDADGAASRDPWAHSAKRTAIVLDDLDELDDDDLADAVSDLRDLALDQTQREKLRQLRLTEQAATAAARSRLATAQKALHAELQKDAPSQSEVNRLVDDISAQEATMRRAQLTALLGAKQLLNATQNAKVKAAVQKATGHSK